MSTTLRHNLDHDPAVVETILEFCRAVQKTGAASLRDGANGHFVNFGEGEAARAPDKNEMDKTERIRLKNRRAQQKLRDRMRQNVEVLETALEDCKKARLALQLERRALESQVGI
jgi:biopolymer transport protein ExbB/TolQ